jgi:transposase
VISLHDKIKNQCRDYAHKLAGDIVDQTDFIAVENLKITNMVKKQAFSQKHFGCWLGISYRKNGIQG